MCLAVVGKVRGDEEVAPVGFRKGDCLPQAGKRAVTEPDRREAEALQPLWRRIGNQGKVLRALTGEQLLRLGDLRGCEEGSNMPLRESSELHHVSRRRRCDPGMRE